MADQPHLDELDVLTSHGCQGIGRALVRAVVEWARSVGYRALTLTTFRDVPWNAPFYTRCGFRILAEHEQSIELAAIVRDEASRGLDPAARVIMGIETQR